MSIAPSTDIVLEVARAADPTRAAAITEKLNALSRQGAASPQDFASALDAAGVDLGATPNVPASGGPLRDMTLARARRAEQAPIKLESVVLTELIGQMLPKDTPSAYGQGYAGDMWRSMLAERVADQIAASGRLGIASRMFAGRPLSASSRLLTPERSPALEAAKATQMSDNALSAPTGANVEHGAVLFARAPKI